MTAVSFHSSESFLSSEMVAILVWGVGVLLNISDPLQNFLLKRGVGLFLGDYSMYIEVHVKTWLENVAHFSHIHACKTLS